jgi:hypothetical protein
LFVFFSKTQFDEMCDCIRMLQEISWNLIPWNS